MSYILLTGIALSVGSPRLQGQTRKTQVVRTEIYRLERQDSCLFVDMNIDLSQVHLAPDCSVFLLPTVAAGQDSVSLPPILLNGPQSDKMYRRRKALNKMTEVEQVIPYLILREDEHPLPCVNYRTRVPYQSWMSNAQISVSQLDCNCDARMLAFEMQIVRIPPEVKIVTRTLRDTIYLTSTPTFQGTASLQGVALSLRSASHCLIAVPSDRGLTVYFPSGSRAIDPGYERNEHFATAIDSLLRVFGNGARVLISGYTSPEGTYASNEALADNRVQALKAYLTAHSQLAQAQIETRTYPEGWLSLAGMIGASDMPKKEAALDIIRNTGIYQGREKKLMDLDRGNAYRFMMKEFFPKLRKVMIEFKRKEDSL